MKKLDLLKVAKIGSLGLSLIGAGLTSWISSQENKKVLEKLVDERLQK